MEGTLTPEQRALLARFDAGWVGRPRRLAEAKERSAVQAVARLPRPTRDMNAGYRDAVREALDQLADNLTTARVSHGKAVMDDTARSIQLVIGVLASATVLGLGLAVWLARSFAKAIGQVVETARQIAELDLPGR